MENLEGLDSFFFFDVILPMGKMTSKNILNIPNATTGQNSGFTLIELLVVVLIIGILTAVGLPEYTKAVEKSRVADANTQLNNLVMAEKAYRLSNTTYTVDLTQLDIELPNIRTDATNTFGTSDWEISVREEGGFFVMYAVRAKEGTPITSGEYRYTIRWSIAPGGTLSKNCQMGIGLPPVPAICKSITGNEQGKFN